MDRWSNVEVDPKTLSNDIPTERAAAKKGESPQNGMILILTDLFMNMEY